MFPWLVNDGVGATFLQGRLGKLVSVESVALEGDEYRSLRAIAAVGGDYGMTLVYLVELFYFHCMNVFKNRCKGTIFI